MLKINLNVFLVTGDQAHIETDNLVQMHEALTYFQSIGALASPQEKSTSKIVDAAPGGEKDEESVDPKEQAPAKKPRTPRTAPAGNAAQPAESAKTEETPPAKSTTKYKPEDITAAVTNLANATSLATARGILETFGVKRAAELKAEQYADFIAACEAAQSANADDAGIL